MREYPMRTVDVLFVPLIAVSVEGVDRIGGSVDDRRVEGAQTGHAKENHGHTRLFDHSTGLGRHPPDHLNQLKARIHPGRVPPAPSMMKRSCQLEHG